MAVRPNSEYYIFQGVNEVAQTRDAYHEVEEGKRVRIHYHKKQVKPKCNQKCITLEPRTKN